MLAAYISTLLKRAGFKLPAAAAVVLSIPIVYVNFSNPASSYTPEPHETLTLADDRKLSYNIVGDKKNKYYFFHTHGNGFSRFQFPVGYPDPPDSPLNNFINEEYANKNNVRFIGIDRPGTAESTSYEGFSYKPFADDVRQLYEHLIDTDNLDPKEIRAGIYGHSVGGPWALTCLEQLDFMVQATIVAPAGPRFLFKTQKDTCLGIEGLPDKNPKLDYIPFVAEWFLRLGRICLYKYPDTYISMLTTAHSYSKADKAVFENIGVNRTYKKHIIKNAREGAQQDVIHNSCKEIHCINQLWDFDVSDINEKDKKHVSIWHGLDDKTLTPKYSEWYHKTIKNSDLFLIENEGHTSLPIYYHDKIVQDFINNLKNYD